MAAWQIVEAQISDSNAHEPFHFITDLLKHAANLAINALAQNNAQTCRRDGMQTRDLGALTVERHPAQQFRCKRRIPLPIERYFIFLVDFVTRMSEAMPELAIVCENEQTFTLRIEPAHAEEPREFPRQQIENCVARVRVAFRGNETGRFVQNDREWKIDTNNFAVHFHVIALARLEAEVGARLSVDGDAPGLDQLIALPARADGGGSEETVQTQSRGYKVKRVTSLKANTLLPFNFVTFLTNHLSDHASGFVLGRPMTLLPSFHCARFLRSSTRSKRFRTLRLAMMVLAPFRLRCCDIDWFPGEIEPAH